MKKHACVVLTHVSPKTVITSATQAPIARERLGSVPNFKEAVDLSNILELNALQKKCSLARVYAPSYPLSSV